MCGEINGEKLLYIKEEEMKIVILDCLSKKKNFVKVARLYLVIERWKMKDERWGVIECGSNHSQ